MCRSSNAKPWLTSCDTAQPSRSSTKWSSVGDGQCPKRLVYGRSSRYRVCHVAPPSVVARMTSAGGRPEYSEIPALVKPWSSSRKSSDMNDGPHVPGSWNHERAPSRVFQSAWPPQSEPLAAAYPTSADANWTSVVPRGIGTLTQFRPESLDRRRSRPNANQVVALGIWKPWPSANLTPFQSAQ